MVHGKKPTPTYTDVGFAGKGYEAHQLINRELRATQRKDLDPNSATLMPLQTLSGSNLGSLEHYSHDWNAAEMGAVNGKSVLPALNLRRVAPSPSNQPDSPVSAGYKMFSLKAAMLDVDMALEV